MNRAALRVGVGYDVHRLAPGIPLVLGGVPLSHDRGPEAHSDGDVLAHAIGDALLGAAALGDLGTHFSNRDPRWKGISSLALLDRIRALLEERRASIVNVDATVIAEAPRLNPHVPAMREAVARALGVPAGCISVKATTSERLGALGREEGIAALAVALVEVSAE